MGKVKVLTARQAADLIKDGDTVTLSGFVANGIAEALNAAAEERFLETGHPKDLTLFWVAGTGNKDGSHADHYAHEGMVKKVIGGHFNFVPKICEMLSALEGPEYLERVAVNNVKNVKNAKKAIKKAFQNQIDGKGFSLVEVLSSCPTNWGMTPQKALEWIDEKMIPYYPLGVYKDKTAEEEAK